MKYVAFTLSIVLTFISFDSALGADRKHKMRIFPRIEVPVDYDDYTWKIALPDADDGQKGEDIPVYIPRLNGGFSYAGTIKPGDAFKFDRFSQFAGSHVYNIPTPKSFATKNEGAQVPESVWVSGLYVKPVSYTPKR